jgi:ketosteroid isomerase-like protein
MTKLSSLAPVLLSGALAVMAAAPTLAQPVVEIRVYTLKPGIRDAFHTRFVQEALPLLQRANIDVVAFGPSLHDSDSYYLIRAFESLEVRDRTEALFYGSREWLEGPRAAVLDAIAAYTTAVVSVDASTLKGLRLMSSPSPAAQPTADDLSMLVQLNDAYIDAVRTSNVTRFSEILAEDFLCTLADGTLLNRAEFLAHAAKPTTAQGLEAHDVNIRVLGDTAIVHAATTFTHPDGRSGRGRYTDVWARRDGRWLAVAAQFARQ